MTEPLLVYESSARSRTYAAVLISIHLGLVLVWLMWQVHWGILLGLWVCSIPALWEYVTAKRAGLTLTAKSLSWHSGRQTGDVALSRITQVDFDTRLDLSIKVTLRIEGGRKIRLPHDCLPKHPALQVALEGLDIKTTRNHFKMF